MNLIDEFTAHVAEKAKDFNLTFDLPTLLKWLVQSRIIPYKTVVQFMSLLHYKRTLPTTRRKHCKRGDKGTTMHLTMQKTGISAETMRYIVKYQNQQFDDSLF